MKIEKLEKILKENPNQVLIWIPANSKLNKSMKYHIKKSERFYLNDMDKYSKHHNKTRSLRGVVLLGNANNKQNNKEIRNNNLIVENNISFAKFEKDILTKLDFNLVSGLYC